jgi:hypothetical protein
LLDRQCGDFNIGGENAFLVKDDTELLRFAHNWIDGIIPMPLEDA